MTETVLAVQVNGKWQSVREIPADEWELEVQRQDAERIEAARFVAAHRIDKATYDRLASDQSGLCGANDCGRPLADSTVTHYIEDAGQRIVCDRCSVYSPVYEGGK